MHERVEAIWIDVLAQIRAQLLHKFIVTRIGSDNQGNLVCFRARYSGCEHAFALADDLRRPLAKDTRRESTARGYPFAPGNIAVYKSQQSGVVGSVGQGLRSSHSQPFSSAMPACARAARVRYPRQ